MDFIVIFILCFLATSKVTVQGFFAKKNIASLSDGVFFNGLIFFFSALIFLNNILNFNIFVVCFSCAFGILTVLFQLCYIKAMASGNVSLTVMIVNLSMIIPIFVSVLCYKESIGVLRLLGICLTIVALCLNVNKDKSVEYKKWFLFCLFASLTNGALAVCQQIFGKTEWKDQIQSFVAWSYIIATFFSMLLYLCFKAKGNGITFNIKPSVFLYSLSVGVILGVFQFINTKAIANINGTLLFPTYNAGTLILSTLSSILILKDKLKNNQKISLFIGVASIVLMNI